jgi:hypothetical protein
MTAASQVIRAATAAVLAAALGLAGCGDDGASSTAGATQTGPSTSSGTGPTTGQIAITVSSAVPTSGNGSVTGTTVADALIGGTNRAVVADGSSASGFSHRIRVDYDSVSGLVLAVNHGWTASTGSAGDTGATACARVVTPTAPTLCVGATVDVAAGRVTFANTLLRGAGAFTSLLNGSITFQAP